MSHLILSSSVQSWMIGWFTNNKFKRTWEVARGKGECFDLKVDEKQEWRKLHNAELHKPHFSPVNYYHQQLPSTYQGWRIQSKLLSHKLMVSEIVGWHVMTRLDSWTVWVGPWAFAKLKSSDRRYNSLVGGSEHKYNTKEHGTSPKAPGRVRSSHFTDKPQPAQ
jgi:hypothetical protein